MCTRPVSSFDLGEMWLDQTDAAHKFTIKAVVYDSLLSRSVWRSSLCLLVEWDNRFAGIHRLWHNLPTKRAGISLSPWPSEGSAFYHRLGGRPFVLLVYPQVMISFTCPAFRAILRLKLKISEQKPSSGHRKEHRQPRNQLMWLTDDNRSHHESSKAYACAIILWPSA